jgi:hypothetical protein
MGFGLSHQCYYCDQIFDSKEQLFDHLEVHGDTKESQEKKPKKKTTHSGKSKN